MIGITELGFKELIVSESTVAASSAVDVFEDRESLTIDAKEEVTAKSTGSDAAVV